MMDYNLSGEAPLRLGTYGRDLLISSSRFRRGNAKYTAGASQNLRVRILSGVQAGPEDASHRLRYCFMLHLIPSLATQQDTQHLRQAGEVERNQAIAE